MIFENTPRRKVHHKINKSHLDLENDIFCLKDSSRKIKKCWLDLKAPLNQKVKSLTFTHHTPLFRLEIKILDFFVHFSKIKTKPKFYFIYYHNRHQSSDIIDFYSSKQLYPLLKITTKGT